MSCENELQETFDDWRRVLTCEEVAAILDSTERTVRKLVYEDELRGFAGGRFCRCLKEDVAARVQLNLVPMDSDERLRQAFEDVPIYLSSRNLAGFLRTRKSVIYGMCRYGNLRSGKVGESWVTTRRDLAALFERDVIDDREEVMMPGYRGFDEDFPENRESRPDVYSNRFEP